MAAPASRRARFCRGVAFHTAAPRLSLRGIDPCASLNLVMHPVVRRVPLLLLAAAAFLAGPAWAGEGYVPPLSFLDPAPAAVTGSTPFAGIDLSVDRDGAERSLRVPLASREDRRALGRVVVPYLSVGATTQADSSIRDNTVLYENVARGQRSGMDMGAGLAWKLSERMELFGEYRFLRMNPDPAEAVGSGVLHRDVDGPLLKGGFTIRLP